VGGWILDWGCMDDLQRHAGFAVDGAMTRKGNGDPYATLLSRVHEEVEEYKEERIEEAATYCKSPIEQLFYVALHMACRYGSHEWEGCLHFEDQETLEHLQSQDYYRLRLLVEFQPQLEGWRPDFRIHYYDFGYRTGVQKWTSLIVECDGHDFHERTKEQAARDRKRDRLAQHKGTPVLRFTGSELWNRSWECALEVIAWAQKGL
jgi:hypothetical protein